MARESHANRLGRYQAELDRAVHWRTSQGYDDLWERMIDLYRGKHHASADVDDATQRLVINMAFATINAIGPSVAVNNPKFSVMARKPQQAPHAIITQEILNYLWRTHKFHKQFRLGVDDQLALGHGWIKVGYRKVKKPVEKPAPDDDGDMKDLEDGEAPGIDDGTPGEGQVETEMRVVDDRPFIERVSPFDMYVDPDAKSVETVRWVAQRIRRAINDVKVDSRYDKKARSKASATSWKQINPNGDNPHEEDNSVGYCDVIEFYDVKANMVCTFVANSGKREDDERLFLIPPKKMPYAFGHPFVMLRNYEVTDYFYPMGELEQIESLQHELNETRTQMLNHRRKNVAKWLIDEARFSQRGIDALKSDKHNTVVPVEGGDDPKTAISPMPGHGITGDAYNMSEVVQDDIRSVTATSEYQSGGGPEIRRTATEAAMIQDAQNARAADKLAKIEGSLAEIGSRVVQLMQQFLTGQHVARVVGSERAPIWVQYDKDYIQGEFDFEVEGGSTQPKNESFLRQSALQFMDAMSMFVQAGVVDPQAVARKVLRDFGIKDADSYLMPAAGPGGPQGPQGPQAPAQGPGMQPGMSAPEEESGVPGIPPELINQLQAQQGLGV